MRWCERGAKWGLLHKQSSRCCLVALSEKGTEMSIQQFDRIDAIVNKLNTKKGATFTSTLSAWAHKAPM